VRILVTGHRGHVGAPVAAHLRRLGHDVAGFDRVDGDDLLDCSSVRRAAASCAAVVHAGALAHDSAGTPEDIMAVNVLGTWHVLLAAEAAALAVRCPRCRASAGAACYRPGAAQQAHPSRTDRAEDRRAA
jgi:nucleoside-diphosphate-sugar epimerase